MVCIQWHLHKHFNNHFYSYFPKILSHSDIPLRKPTLFQHNGEHSTSLIKPLNLFFQNLNDRGIYMNIKCFNCFIEI